MEVQVYVRNLSKSTTSDELEVLFARAGTVTAVDLIRNRRSGIPIGFAFITMSAQSEADKAVSMFNAHALNDQALQVMLATPREQYRFGTPI